MSGQEVPRLRTPLTELELLEALRAGHVLAFGTEPSPSRLAVAWAQCALEHGRGKAIDQFCIGNVTCGPSWTGDWYTLDCPERVQRNPDRWETKHLRFRAYASAAEGVAGYWRVIGGRYVRVLPYFDRDDPAGAAHLLSGLGYYTALPGPYAGAMVSLERYCTTKLLPQLRPLQVAPVAGCAEPDCEGELRTGLDADATRLVLSDVAQSLYQLSDELLGEMRRDARETVPD